MEGITSGKRLCFTHIMEVMVPKFLVVFLSHAKKKKLFFAQPLEFTKSRKSSAMALCTHTGYKHNLL